MYRCEATSLEGFVQQLACNLINHGYWFYTRGQIPPTKDPLAVDRKLIDGYGLTLSKWQRARLKAKGGAKLSYLRWKRTIVIIATEGEHVFYRREAVKDIRRHPILIGGYSIGCSRGSDGRYHASVKIEPDTFRERLDYFRGIAVHRSAESLKGEFKSLRFTPYARVRRQLLRILSEVNTLRVTAGFKPLPTSVLNLTRAPVKVFREKDAPDESLVGNL